jgi:hypothetical protein
LPDLFAGKLHALLFRKWKSRVKGRDWYDFVWFTGHHPRLNLRHLEQRMRQTGHWDERSPLTTEAFHALLQQAIDRLDVRQAKEEVRPFLKDPSIVDVWSREFFASLKARIEFPS